MKTREYLRKYAYLYLYVVSGFLFLAALTRQAVETVSAPGMLDDRPTIVIDAGHGGIDGGSVSCTGVPESRINLEVALRLEQLLGLLGYDTVMVRASDTDLATEGTTIRQQKNSDLRNRVAMVNALRNPLLVSIHQNHFTQSQYSGPQVFHAGDPDSQNLAQAMQANLNQATGSRRICKVADNIYLMKQINCSGILVECGFLSNPAEESLLRQSEYQKKLCCIIGATLAQWLESKSIS